MTILRTDRSPLDASRRPLQSNPTAENDYVWSHLEGASGIQNPKATLATLA